MFTDELLLLCEPRNSNYDTFLQSLDNIMAYVVFPQNIVLVTYQDTDLFIRMILPFETGVFFFFFLPLKAQCTEVSILIMLYLSNHEVIMVICSFTIWFGLLIAELLITTLAKKN